MAKEKLEEAEKDIIRQQLGKFQSELPMLLIEREIGEANNTLAEKSMKKNRLLLTRLNNQIEQYESKVAELKKALEGK